MLKRKEGGREHVRNGALSKIRICQIHNLEFTLATSLRSITMVSRSLLATCCWRRGRRRGEKEVAPTEIEGQLQLSLSRSRSFKSFEDNRKQERFTLSPRSIHPFTASYPPFHPGPALFPTTHHHHHVFRNHSVCISPTSPPTCPESIFIHVLPFYIHLIEILLQIHVVLSQRLFIFLYKVSRPKRNGRVRCFEESEEVSDVFWIREGEKGGELVGCWIGMDGTGMS